MPYIKEKSKLFEFKFEGSIKDLGEYAHINKLFEDKSKNLICEDLAVEMLSKDSLYLAKNIKKQLRKYLPSSVNIECEIKFYQGSINFEILVDIISSIIDIMASLGGASGFIIMVKKSIDRVMKNQLGRGSEIEVEGGLIHPIEETEIEEDSVSPDTREEKLKIGTKPTTQIIPYRKLKLWVTLISLILFQVFAIISLLRIGTTGEENVALGGLSLFKPWLLGALGGLVGGTSRSMFRFLKEVSCWLQYPNNPKHNNSWCKDINVNYDCIKGWYLFLIKPFIGLGVGFIFTVLYQIGLIPFLSNINIEIQSSAIVFIGTLAGIFAESALEWLSRLFKQS